MQKHYQSNMINNDGATFSDCRKYRFVLWRIWDEILSKVMFIGLNPSTANETSDDPTIRRIKSLARHWGYGGIYMLNLFTYVTAYPNELSTCNNPSYLANDYLMKYSKECSKIIFAWGAFNQAKERSIEIIKMFPNAECLARNKDGSPKHPLYTKNDITLKLWS